MYLIRRLFYYVVSLMTVVRGVRNWPSLFRLLKRGAEPVELTLRNGPRYLVRSLMDVWIIKETNLDRDYEKHGVPIQDGWNIVDIGARLGHFTVFAARRTPHGHVYAHEPAPDSIVLLHRNLAINAISNVEAFPYAVSYKAGISSLDISGGVAVQYSTVDTWDAAGSRIEVSSVSLADVLAALPGGTCDLLKIDAEGAEYDMLLNLDDESLAHIRRICLEYHNFVTPYSHIDLVRHLQAKGWHVRVSPSKVRKDLGFLYAAARRM